MSIKRTVNVTCPRCKNTTDFVVWDCINTAKNPEMLEKVKDGSAFVFKCPDCGIEFPVKYDTLYHQIDDSIMIQYAENDATAADFLRLNSSDSDDSPRKLFPGYILRLVRSQNQLKEKVRIFEAGLDDRMVELTKVAYLTMVVEKNPEFEPDETIFDFGPDGNRMVLLFFKNDKLYASSELDKTMYEHIKETFEPLLPGIREDQSVVVDLPWAINKVSELG